MPRQPRQPVATQNSGPRPLFGGGGGGVGVAKGGRGGSEAVTGPCAAGGGAGDAGGGGGAAGRGAAGRAAGGLAGGGGGAGGGNGGWGAGAGGRTGMAGCRTVASTGGTLEMVVAPRSSASPSIITLKGTPPSRSSWPLRSPASATRWLSRKVPLALAWSTTAQLSPRHTRRACRRDTEPSGTTTSQVASRPTSTSLVISKGAPKTGIRRSVLI